jgi:glucose/arabinose dehydrogenase
MRLFGTRHQIIATSIALVGAAWVGCGSDATEDNVGPGGTLPDGSGLSPEPSAGAGEAPPPPPRPREFSLSTPSLSGFALVDAFPGAQLSLPSAVAWPKGGRPLVLQRHGTVEQITSGGSRRVLDFSSRVHLASEGGALGMALHPNFGDGSGASPYAYFWYNAAGMRQRLSRFTWNPASQSFDGGSELVLVDQAEEKGEHNAGRVAFGPDGFLYFGNGDDDDLSGGNDQRLDRDLVAGVFRIDVDFRGGW